MQRSIWPLLLWAYLALPSRREELTRNSDTSHTLSKPDGVCWNPQAAGQRPGTLRALGPVRVPVLRRTEYR
jgi:hypothetical protein